jgi:hypothetical protein
MGRSKSAREVASASVMRKGQNTTSTKPSTHSSNATRVKNTTRCERGRRIRGVGGGGALIAFECVKGLSLPGRNEASHTPGQSGVTALNRSTRKFRLRVTTAVLTLHTKSLRRLTGRAGDLGHRLVRA